VDPEAAAELGEAAALAGVMAVRGVRSCRERLAPGRHAASKHLAAARAGNAGWGGGFEGLGGAGRDSDRRLKSLGGGHRIGRVGNARSRDARARAGAGAGIVLAGVGCVRHARAHARVLAWGSGGFSPGRPRRRGGSHATRGASAAGSARPDLSEEQTWPLGSRSSATHSHRKHRRLPLDCHCAGTAESAVCVRVWRRVRLGGRRPLVRRPRPRRRALGARSGRG
jgi:hypothetical protein